MDMDLTVIERSGYTVVDLLSDVGGILGLLLTIFGSLLNIWNHNFLENYLLLRLFGDKYSHKEG